MQNTQAAERIETHVSSEPFADSFLSELNVAQLSPVISAPAEPDSSQVDQVAGGLGQSNQNSPAQDRAPAWKAKRAAYQLSRLASLGEYIERIKEGYVSNLIRNCAFKAYQMGITKADALATIKRHLRDYNLYLQPKWIDDTAKDAMADAEMENTRRNRRGL